MELGRPLIPHRNPDYIFVYPLALIKAREWAGGAARLNAAAASTPACATPASASVGKPGFAPQAEPGKSHGAPSGMPEGARGAQGTQGGSFLENEYGAEHGVETRASL